jgi:hypothetical protein
MSCGRSHASPVAFQVRWVARYRWSTSAQDHLIAGHPHRRPSDSRSTAARTCLTCVHRSDHRPRQNVRARRMPGRCQPTLYSPARCLAEPNSAPRQHEEQNCGTHQNGKPPRPGHQHAVQMYAGHQHAEQMYAEQMYAEQMYAEQMYAEQMYAEQMYAEQMYAEQMYAEQMYAEHHYGERQFQFEARRYGPGRHDQRIATARNCLLRCRPLSLGGHARWLVPNAVRAKEYLADRLGVAQQHRRTGGCATTVRQACPAQPGRPSPPRYAPLPRSSSRLALRPLCSKNHCAAQVCGSKTPYTQKCVGAAPSTGAAPTKVCPAASYSPTRSPAQYHRR